MYNATETQKEIAKYLNELLNDFFGAVWVPIWSAEHIRRAGLAIGINVQSTIWDMSAGKVLVKLA